MKIDTSAFDEPTEQEAPSIDTSAFDEDGVQQQDESENITQTPIEAAFSELTPAITAGTVEAIRQGAASSPVSSLAEDLAFRGAGGYATPIGTDLVKERAISKGISQLMPSSAVEPTVSPSKVGRAILEEKLLGPFGLGTKEGSLSRATKSAIEASKPTNELLKALSTPISKEDIYNRTSQILDIPNLDLAVPENKMIVKALEKRKEDLQGFQLPLEAEETKRQLQGSVNYQSDKSAAKSAVSKAQARATREQTEKAAQLAGKLEDFLKLKSQSGNVQAAKDIIESQIKPSNVTFPGSGLINMVADLATKKAPAIGATALDTVGKVAKSKLGKALPYVAGALAGGIPAVAGEIAGEALDSTTSGATPDMPEYWLERGVRNPEKQLQKARLASFKQGLPEAPSEIPSRFEAPEVRQRKEQVLAVKKAGALAPTYVEAPVKQVLKADNPAEISSIAQSMQASPDRASQEYSRVLSQIVDAPASQKEAVLFGLNQQPAFREILKKIKGE
jgi:hypothetical protein